MNLHCALCDDVLFTTPLHLAAGLLDVDSDQSESSAYALACRFQSAVCIAIAQQERAQQEPQGSEMVYEKLQQVLLKLRDGRSGRSSPLKELQIATLLHGKFLLELCFGCGRSASTMPSGRLAIRLFSAMHLSDGLAVWSIVEELRACMKRTWQQHKTAEGYRLQVACVTLQIYALTSLLSGSSRVLENLEKQSEYSVTSALDDITSAAQALTMTESHQVSSFKAKGAEENDAYLEVSWLVSWMVLHATATLFCPKPCNVTQMAITSWAIKHARDLATGQPHTSVAVSLRAVALLISWRQKLETVTMDEEDTMVEVIKALSAASGHSTSQSTDCGNLVMVLLETPSLILQLNRVRCVLHDDDSPPQSCLVCVPGTAQNDKRLSREILKSEGLSPEQLPLEFPIGRPEEWPEDETSWMIRALKDQNRPEAVFTVYGGMILEGDDILMATMSLTAAKVRCTSLPNCCGFYSEDWPTDSGLIEGRSEAEQVDVHFKTTWRPRPASRQGFHRGGPVAYQKERASPLFTRRRGYALDGTDLFVSEMTIEGAKRFCAELQDCEGFTFKGSCVDGTTLIHFKSRSRLMLDSTGMSTCYVFETESRSHALPADGATFFQLITDGKEEVDLLEEVEIAKAPTPEPSRIPSGPLVEGPR